MNPPEVGLAKPRATAQAPPEIAALLDWLLDGPIRLPGGLTAAWLEASRPVYPYEEATGYLIAVLAWRRRQTGDERLRQEALRSAMALAHAIAARPGCGRDGNIYLFDTAVCLRSLGMLTAAFPKGAAEIAVFADLQTRLAQTVCRMLRLRQASDSPADPRWSDSFTVHLLKILPSFAPWLPVLSEPPDWRRLADELIDTHYRDGLFRLDGSSHGVYLHAHCYAAEGLLGLATAGYERANSLLPAIGERLAALQLPSGALPRHWPPNGDPEPAGDATAQAVRLWQCLDHQAFAAPIARGLAFLRTLLDPAGGLCYSPRLPHPNSWVTIFALQAFLWGDGPGDRDWLI